MFEPFPALKKKCTGDPQYQTVLEPIEDAEYHLDHARREVEMCQQPARESQVHLHEGEVVILYHHAAAIAQHGDTAVRAAISALEVGLQVTNVALGLGLARKKVDHLEVRKKLSIGSPILAELGAIFESIGYELFVNYRHWITHRGAPRVISGWRGAPVEVPIERPRPDSPRFEADLEHAQVQAINDFLRTNSEVICRPFVPPVHRLVDDRRGPEGREFLGADKAPGIVVQNCTVSIGHLKEPASAYRARNQVDLGAPDATIAGEAMHRYPARDYMHAVDEAVMFVAGCLSGEWDRLLAAALGPTTST